MLHPARLMSRASPDFVSEGCVVGLDVVESSGCFCFFVALTVGIAAGVGLVVVDVPSVSSSNNICHTFLSEKSSVVEVFFVVPIASVLVVTRSGFWVTVVLLENKGSMSLMRDCRFGGGSILITSLRAAGMEFPVGSGGGWRTSRRSIATGEWAESER